MGIFSRKSKASSSSLPAAPALPAGTVIQVMPDKFLPVTNTGNSTPKHFWTATKIWAVVLTVIAALLGLVYYLVATAPAPAAVSTNKPLTNTESLTTAITSEVVAPETTTIPSETITPTSETAPSQESSDEISKALTILPPSTDSDGDTLTDVEELAYGTDPAKTDTDDDGYPDGTEVNGGFNPKGRGTLAASGLVKTYTIPETGERPSDLYRVTYPAGWAAQFSAAVNNETYPTLIINTGSGESFVIKTTMLQTSVTGVRPTLQDWYLAAFPNLVDTAQTENIGSYIGIFSPDRRTFHFISPNNANVVFSINDQVGTKTSIDYDTTFRSMITSFVVPSYPGAS